MTETPIDLRGPEIVTEGSGWHEQLGDRAELDVTFTAAAKTRADAVRDLGRRITGATRALELPGVVVRNRRFWVHNEWRGNRVVGCRAGEDLALVVTDVTALEEVLAALVGAEPTDLIGPRWALTDPAAARREAQRRAVQDARQRAEGYAAALDGRLGVLRRLSDGLAHDGQMMFAASKERREPTGPEVRTLGLEPEPVRVNARCTTTWTLLT